MNKSFGYDSLQNKFRIARHEVGDFGLHLSLIRSFSWGNNMPPESPFFPGRPLPYHYYFDFLAGLLERIGIRIDLAFNGLSVFCFTLLLFLIYKLPQIIFKKSKLLGILSVVLFIFHSNMTFIDFIKGKTISPSFFQNLWLLPDYIHKGPFDGSLISIFFTLNVFLNQRHLIAALMISLFVFYCVLQRISQKHKSSGGIILLGIVLGLSSRFHTLIFLGTLIILLFLLLFFKRFRLILFLFAPALIIFSFHLKDILGQDLTHIFFNPGFLAERPLTIWGFSKFWFLNLGLAIVLIPLSFFISDIKQKKIFLSFFPLFVLGNLFQFGFRMDHNHSLFNLFLIFANFYIAFLLLSFWQKKFLGKIVFVVFIFFLTFSGLIDLMAIKNDFQYPFFDAPANKFMFWIKKNTGEKDVFLSREEILDPVTLSGRRNYFGHRYYLSALGYNFSQREQKVKKFWEVTTVETLDEMRKEGIRYIVVPAHKIPDFNFQVDTAFLKENIALIYKDAEVLVFKL